MQMKQIDCFEIIKYNFFLFHFHISIQSRIYNVIIALLNLFIQLIKINSNIYIYIYTNDTSIVFD